MKIKGGFMKLSSSFLHFEHTPALDEKIKEASEKMSKFFQDQGTLTWTCYLQKNISFTEVNYKGPHCEYHAKASSEDMYECIDLAINKIEKQAFKTKEKFNKIHRVEPIHFED